MDLHALLKQEGNHRICKITSLTMNLLKTESCRSVRSFSLQFLHLSLGSILLDFVLLPPGPFAKMYSLVLSSLACIFVSVAASPTPTWKGLSKRNTTSPCAEVSSSAAAQASAAVPTVSGQLAYDCLNSVSLHKEEALDLMNSLLPYTLWQTGKEIDRLRQEKNTNFNRFVG